MYNTNAQDATKYMYNEFACIFACKFCSKKVIILAMKWFVLAKKWFVLG